MKTSFSNKLLKWLTKGTEDIYTFAPEIDHNQILRRRKEYYLQNDNYIEFITTQITNSRRNQQKWRIIIKLSAFSLMFTKLMILIFAPLFVAFIVCGFFWSPGFVIGLGCAVLGAAMASISIVLRTVIKSFDPQEQLKTYEHFEEKLILNRNIPVDEIYRKIEEGQPALQTLFTFDGSIPELFVVLNRFEITDKVQLLDFCFHNIARKDGSTFKYSSLQSTLAQIKSLDKDTKGGIKKLINFYEQRIIDTQNEVERLKNHYKIS